MYTTSGDDSKGIGSQLENCRPKLGKPVQRPTYICSWKKSRFFFFFPITVFRCRFAFERDYATLYTHTGTVFRLVDRRFLQIGWLPTLLTFPPKLYYVCEINPIHKVYLSYRLISFGTGSDLISRSDFSYLYTFAFD